MLAEEVDRAADELYGLPLADFTKGRDEVVRRLRNEGQRDEADAVKALRKPTAAAWALNQLARRRGKEVERLLGAGARLRKAHEALVGGGDRVALHDASVGERELVDKLTRDATAIAVEAGSAATTTLDERIRNTLHAAALDEETAAELAAGRLLREREAVGMFGDAASQSAAPVKPRSADKDRGRERQLAAARAEEQQARREHARAVKATARAGKHAAATQKRADEAQRQLAEARAGLREAERRERDAAKALDRAARAVASAERKTSA